MEGRGLAVLPDVVGNELWMEGERREEHISAGQHVFGKGMCTLGQHQALSLAALCSLSLVSPWWHPGSPRTGRWKGSLT